MSLHHRADLIRSVLEGVALQSVGCSARSRSSPGPVSMPSRILGGGAESDLWCQIHADAPRRVERVTEPMAAQSRGAALIAALALGVIGFDDVPALVPVDRASCRPAGDAGS